MVFINSQKFACASCIKGHRSSSCHHTDRPLFEIKKKGRPISQCERCRELRKNKHMHVKCTCASVTASQSNSNVVEPREVTLSAPHGPAQRKIPSTPALPNGLQDIWSKSVSPAPTKGHSKQRVDSLLNPCPCKSIWKCSCRERNYVATREEEDDNPPPIISQISSCCGGKDPEAPTLTGSSLFSHGTNVPTPTASSHREKRRLATVPYTHSSAAKSSAFTIPTSSLRDLPNTELDLTLGLDLPPLKGGIGDSDIDKVTPLMLPPLKTVYQSGRDATDANALALASLTRCGCGNTCVCPGCKEHRGEQAALSGEDCPDRCGSCVDHVGGIALPSPLSITVTSSASGRTHSCHSFSGAQSHSHTLGEHSNGGMSTLDHFYAIAALLPPPPQSSRNCGPGTLDPTNVVVYPQHSGSKQDWRKAAGLVQVPPLNCCAGRCKCTGGTCGCGSECGGSCGKHSIPLGNIKGSEHGSSDAEGTGKENGDDRPAASCCAAKQKAGGGGASKPSRNILRL